jgi:hypothetical protein
MSFEGILFEIDRVCVDADLGKRAALRVFDATVTANVLRGSFLSLVAEPELTVNKHSVLDCQRKVRKGTDRKVLWNSRPLETSPCILVPFPAIVTPADLIEAIEGAAWGLRDGEIFLHGLFISPGALEREGQPVTRVPVEWFAFDRCPVQGQAALSITYQLEQPLPLFHNYYPDAVPGLAGKLSPDTVKMRDRVSEIDPGPAEAASDPYLSHYVVNMWKPFRSRVRTHRRARPG